MLFEVFSREEMEQIRQASLGILERIGFKLQHEAARDLLAKHGCSVEGERVRIPESLVAKLLAQVPRSFAMYGRNLGHEMEYGGGQVHLRTIISMPYVLDFATGERRSPVMRDAQELVRIADALPNYHVVNSVVYPRDVPADMNAVLEFVNSCQFSEKPNDITVESGPEVRAIARIGAAIRGSEQALREKPLTLIYVSPTSPLSLGHQQSEAVMETARAGIPFSPLPCPVLGISSPVTIAGTVAQQTAEVLACLVLAYLVNPGIPFVYSTRPSPPEMRTGASLWGSPEIGLASAASTQVAHFLGMPANACGLTTSGKAMDEQVGFEKALNGLVAALAGCEVLTGGGSLEDALSTSYQQLVIDDEIMSMIYRFLKGARVDSEALAVEVVERVMDGGSFLSEPHTRRFFRAGELWQSVLANRQLFHEWQAEGGRRIEEVAAEGVRTILADHQVAPLPPEVQSEVDAIVKAVQREMAAAGAS